MTAGDICENFCLHSRHTYTYLFSPPFNNLGVAPVHPLGHPIRCAASRVLTDDLRTLLLCLSPVPACMPPSALCASPSGVRFSRVTSACCGVLPLGWGLLCSGCARVSCSTPCCPIADMLPLVPSDSLSACPQATSVWSSCISPLSICGVTPSVWGPLRSACGCGTQCRSPSSAPPAMLLGSAHLASLSVPASDPSTSLLCPSLRLPCPSARLLCPSALLCLSRFS